MSIALPRAGGLTTAMPNPTSAPRHKPKPGRLAAVVLLALLFQAGDPAMSETVPQPGSPPAAPSGVPAVGGGASVIPDAYKLNMLIRTTLIALSQANETGNYSVLRDLGTPQFQAMNTDARLGEIFSALRRRALDFSPVLFFEPKLVREPAIQANGILRLTGYMDTRPERVLFDMGFENIAGAWKLAAIIVDMQNAPAQSSEQKPAATAPPAAQDGAKAKPPAKRPAAAN